MVTDWHDKDIRARAAVAVSTEVQEGARELIDSALALFEEARLLREQSQAERARRQGMRPVLRPR